MNRYERWVSAVAGSIVTTAHETSEVIVSVALALIAVVSAVPEFMGLWHTSGNPWLALAVAATGAGVAHTAVKTRYSIAWAAFGVQLVVVEVILAMQGGTAELAYPIVNVVGAAVMAIAREHRVTTKAEAAEAKEDKAFEREEKRKDNELKRQLRLEKERAKVSKPTVNKGVKSTTGDSVKQSSDRQSDLLTILQSFDTPDDINRSAIARQLGVSRQTIYNDMEELQKSGRLSLNGHVQVNT